jgi:hypothetical protein
MAGKAISKGFKNLAKNYISGPGGEMSNKAMSSASAALEDYTIANFLGKRSYYHNQAHELENAMIQGREYGGVIPFISGKARLAGSIVWAPPLESEYRENTENKAGGEYATHARHNYGWIEYYANLALIICEGEVEELTAIWAGKDKLDSENIKYRFYPGTEDQMPDPLIESYLGSGNTPAYRGLCYIVFENLALSQFNYTIPNFMFEVINKTSGDSIKTKKPENLVTSVVITPGAGEYIYETRKVSKQLDGGEHYEQPLNYSTGSEKAVSRISLEQLRQTFPHLEWVSPTICWYGGSLDISTCEITPAVEFSQDNASYSSEWKVAGIHRQEAREISKDQLDRPNHGGTPSDESIIRYLDLLRENKLKIMFCPMLMLDLETKPWRGNLTGKPEDIKRFFRGPRGYNEFILHYADLVKGRVDAFLIGSELKNLTGLQANDKSFPAASELVRLAGMVKQILGNKVFLSYAADWSEYHHCPGGWHHLDELWASENIDFIGINAYFPLTMTGDSNISEQQIKRGWSSGEAFDYYFTDDEAITLEEQYGFKNLRYWWENKHINPDGGTTNWHPKSKKIWFCEYGFPSLDKATNQPNKFYDPGSCEGDLPIHSSGEFDPEIQRKAIKVAEEVWQNNDMVENKFLWSYDVRPYPLWPDSEFWTDGSLWRYSHAVNGKFGPYNADFADILPALASKAGIEAGELKYNFTEGHLPPAIMSRQLSIFDYLSLLSTCYGYELRNKNGKLELASPSGIRKENLTPGETIETRAGRNLYKIPTGQIISGLKINYYSAEKEYQLSNLTLQSDENNGSSVAKFSLDLVLSTRQAEDIGRAVIEKSCHESYVISLAAAIEHYRLSPGDIIELERENLEHPHITDKFSNLTIKIKSTELKNYCVYIDGVIL